MAHNLLELLQLQSQLTAAQSLNSLSQLAPPLQQGDPQQLLNLLLQRPMSALLPQHALLQQAALQQSLLQQAAIQQNVLQQLAMQQNAMGAIQQQAMQQVLGSIFHPPQAPSVIFPPIHLTLQPTIQPSFPMSAHAMSALNPSQQLLLNQLNAGLLAQSMQAPTSAFAAFTAQPQQVPAPPPIPTPAPAPIPPAPRHQEHKEEKQEKPHPAPAPTAVAHSSAPVATTSGAPAATPGTVNATPFSERYTLEGRVRKGALAERKLKLEQAEQAAVQAAQAAAAASSSSRRLLMASMHGTLQQQWEQLQQPQQQPQADAPTAASQKAGAGALTKAGKAGRSNNTVAESQQQKLQAMHEELNKNLQESTAGLNASPLAPPILPGASAAALAGGGGVFATAGGGEGSAAACKDAGSDAWGEDGGEDADDQPTRKKPYLCTPGPVKCKRDVFTRAIRMACAVLDVKVSDLAATLQEANYDACSTKQAGQICAMLQMHFPARGVILSEQAASSALADMLWAIGSDQCVLSRTQLEAALHCKVLIHTPPPASVAAAQAATAAATACATGAAAAAGGAASGLNGGATAGGSSRAGSIRIAQAAVQRQGGSSAITTRRSGKGTEVDEATPGEEEWTIGPLVTFAHSRWCADFAAFESIGLHTRHWPNGDSTLHDPAAAKAANAARVQQVSQDTTGAVVGANKQAK